MQRLTNLIRWANILLILTTFVSYLSPYISPAVFWPFSFFGLAYPWLLLGNSLFVIFWVISKKWYFLFSLVTILIGWNHFSNLIAFNLPNVGSNNAIQVVSFNLNSLKKMNLKDKEKKSRLETELVNLIKGENGVDILCTQESSSENVGLLTYKLGFKYNHRSYGHSTAIISKHPIVEKGEILFKKSNNSSAWVDIQIDEKIIRVYSLHLQSTKVAPATDELLKEGNLKEKETWLNIKGILGRVKRASVIRATQAQIVKEHMEKCKYPIILCGDFNDTPLSFAYKLLSDNFKDTFKEKGFGMSSTYAGLIPALRIDYIFADQSMKVNNYKMLKNGSFSDHYGIKSEIIID